jgi:3-methyladenine DNA glycosylase AlkD
MDPVITMIREELAASADEETRKSTKRFFKEEITVYGVKSAVVGKIATAYWKQIRTREKPEIFALCEELYQSGYCEEAFIVSSWAEKLSDRYERGDLVVFRDWINRYITNWAACDGFCNHTLGSFMEQYPDCIEELKQWTGSPNRWMRRASAVSLIIPAKHGKFLDEVVAIADRLLTDDDDMVRKGYGWLLKEASRHHQQEVFSYVMANRQKMPRTSLRYAIELMPPDLRARAMKKDW